MDWNRHWKRRQVYATKTSILKLFYSWLWFIVILNVNESTCKTSTHTTQYTMKKKTAQRQFNHNKIVEMFNDAIRHHRLTITQCLDHCCNFALLLLCAFILLFLSFLACIIFILGARSCSSVSWIAFLVCKIKRFRLSDNYDMMICCSRSSNEFERFFSVSLFECAKTLTCEKNRITEWIAMECATSTHDVFWIQFKLCFFN